MLRRCFNKHSPNNVIAKKLNTTQEAFLHQKGNTRAAMMMKNDESINKLQQR
jgi:hypothetical protein